MTKRARALFVVVAVVSFAGCSGGSSGGDPLLCDAGQHVCAGACASDTSPLTCGTRCAPCPGTANGTPICDAGACGFACSAGYAPCETGCCLATPPNGSVVVDFEWPTAGHPLAAGARLEVIHLGQVTVLDAPATSLTLEGLPDGRATFRLRLLDGQDQVLARGGGAVMVTPAAAAWLPISTDAAGLSGCAILDTVPEEDLAVDVADTRFLTPGPRDGGFALLLAPSHLAWSMGGAGVATVDAVTGEVAPLAPGYAEVALRCGPEEAPNFQVAAAVTPATYGATTTIFVRDRTSADAAPVASLVADPPAADFDFTFRLDASATTDDGAAAALRWRFDWEGDGTWDTPFATRDVRFHKYAWADTYQPIVQVVDAAGHAARATRSLPVAEPTGVRVILDQTSYRFWRASGTWRFQATVTGSADTGVTWSMLEGDVDVAGQCIPSYPAGSCEYSPPRASGFYHLVATANADPAKKAMAEIEVYNQPPAADCHVQLGTGIWTDWAIVGQTVWLDGTRSRDTENTALTYRWWYREGGVDPRVDLPGTSDVILASFDTQGVREFDLDVTDGGGEVGTGTCGTVTWAPAKGHPMGQSVGAAFWDDPAVSVEYVVTANGGDPATWSVSSCTRAAGATCMTRTGSEACTFDGTGVGAPYLRCGSGSWYVVGPESGEGHLWTGDTLWGWRPLQNTSGQGLTMVGVAGRGYDCLNGPFCP